MATYSQLLEANQEYDLPIVGTFFQLLSASGELDIEFMSENNPKPDSHKGIPQGFWYDSKTRLTQVKVKSNVRQVVKYIYANGRTGIDRSEIVTTLSQSSVLTDIEPKTINQVSSKVTDYNSSRKRIIFTANNNNTGVICLGGQNVNLNNSAIILAAGESYIEDNAALAEFYAISNADNQILRINEA